MLALVFYDGAPGDRALPMLDFSGRILRNAVARPFYFGQVAVKKSEDGRFVLSHRDDESPDLPQLFRSAEAASEIARFDDAGNYRPLKTAPNLRHGWRLELETLEDLTRALDYFYPGRLAVFAAWKKDELQTTPLRETLNRQSGMYRVAAKITDSQINDIVAGFCRSDGSCLRTVLWTRDGDGASASTKLPKAKFDPAFDQASRSSFRRRNGEARASQGEVTTIPLLCQEACNLLVAECRKVVKGKRR